MEKYLLLMYDRPGEPIFVPKGEDKISFDIPINYVPEKYQGVASHILNRFCNEAQTSVPVKEISIPDLSIPLALNRRDAFSLYIPSHQKMAEHLINLFLGMRTVEDLVSFAAYCRDRINIRMFIYCLTVAILHRTDTNYLPIPSLLEVFPSDFIDSGFFVDIKEEANIVPSGSRVPIEIPLDWTATDVDPEHRVAYWREDVGVNLHHWHWHVIYPFAGPSVVVNKDRRGELFYYFHRQMMARYNTERLSNNIGRTRALTNLREPLKEGYYPKLDQVVASRVYPSRSPNMVMSDVQRSKDRLSMLLSDLERWRDVLYEVIKTRQIRNDKGRVIQLDDVKGIDILGNMVESSILSPNSALYGNLHNSGHVILSLVHDPDNRYLESFGVMADDKTAMRDPIFYVWHQFIDDIFVRFKDSLTPYTLEQLNFPGVKVVDIRVSVPRDNPNILNTHWTKSDVELSHGLDFVPRGSILVRLQHLNHDDFSYSFVVSNTNNREVVGTLRVFMAPKHDEKGQLLPFNEQRKLMIEMDRFITRLRRGQNVITRRSTESSLTIPFEVTFRDLNKPVDQTSKDFNYCGCGWPQHMLLPRGTTQGYPMELFVMITNYDLDRVNQADPVGCTNSVSFCGLRDRKYPDTRAMGFPFDRMGRQGVKTLSEFLTPNMKLQQVTVRFNDVIKPRQRKDVP
ncbi:hypothetical protein QAD02_014948 [Eretmocerus hayati]|uniref:Uncharacterized protein n=1 Tax=Eretmocerus hayati TaxID=131215 RepID=A0ACC2P6V8_9HYME|nr:hypothetical protein QAD02_014948 [Eretmocerus hayati]